MLSLDGSNSTNLQRAQAHATTISFDPPSAVASHLGPTKGSTKRQRGRRGKGAKPMNPEVSEIIADSDEEFPWPVYPQKLVAIKQPSDEIKPMKAAPKILKAQPNIEEGSLVYNMPQFLTPFREQHLIENLSVTAADPRDQVLFYQMLN